MIDWKNVLWSILLMMWVYEWSKNLKLIRFSLSHLLTQVARSPLQLTLNMIMLCHFKNMTGHIWNSCVWYQQRIVWSMKTLFMKRFVENGSEVIQKQPLPLITSFLVAVLFFQRRFTLFTSYYPLVVLWWKSRWNCKNLLTPPNRQVLLIFLCI